MIEWVTICVNDGTGCEVPIRSTLTLDARGTVGRELGSPMLLTKVIPNHKTLVLWDTALFTSR